MGLTAITSIHDRQREITIAVAESFLLPGNQPDEIIVVLDRATRQAADAAVEAYSKIEQTGITVRMLRLEGRPGWRCPTRPLNAAITAASEKIVCGFSSEIILKAGSIHAAAAALAGHGHAIFGEVNCSCGPQLHGTITGPDKPMPYGQLWAAPKYYLTFIKGFDNKFEMGRGFDDSDLFLRLWHLGVNFDFTRSLAGLHICHDRADDASEATGRGLERNAGIFLEKYGTLEPWGKQEKTETRTPNRTEWRHL